ncbi:MAG: pyridoxal phosphate-dependent decarboxylase family protein [Dermatophilaceae bacterium]
MNPHRYQAVARSAVALLASYVERTARGDGPAVSRRPRDEVTRRLDLAGVIRDGGLADHALGTWLSAYLEHGVHLHHPRQMCHQVAVPGVGAALADLVHGVVNQPMSVYEMGGGAASAELAVLEWMTARAGWSPETAGGVLTHGGSLANLTALLAARARAAPDAWRAGTPRDLVLLAAPAAHYCVAKAAGIMGLGTAGVVALDVDHLGRVRPDSVEAALARVAAEGRRPMAVVASACATATGLHDDLRWIGEICRRHDVWFHVDGAHGASALLSPRHRARLDGVELADSLVWDAHKMLRSTSLCAAVLVRRAETLATAFHQQASYLELTNPRGDDVIGLQVETTKAELGLKILLTLAVEGEAGLRAYVERQYAMAQTLWQLVQARPGYAAPYRPESNIVCFRYGGPDTDQDAIRAVLLADGRFHIGAADVSGARHLRVVVMSPATTADDLSALLDAVEDAAGRHPHRALPACR